MQIICEERAPNIVIVACTGSLEAGTVAKLKTAVRPWLGQGACHLLLDGAHLDFIDSTGLGVLLALQRQVRATGGSLRVCAPTDDVASILQMTKLQRVLDVTPSVDAACAHIRADHR